ncbi:hypothetical protein [Sagittula sp. S175]|uniref:hypothetical protein n=1 Tax=Sagittula sp. S175 TaxID=3415129 RepID=UPI003C7BB360
MTDDYVLFQMWGSRRQSLIDGHQFYVEQARNRLLNQFGNMEADADQASKDWLKKASRDFDPDRHDEGVIYDAAEQAGVDFYQLLSDMRDQTYLSVVAGMYHGWDKQLRSWLAGEVHHWYSGSAASQKIWSINAEKIEDLLQSQGWGFSSKPYHRLLDACRLIVNVYKHGEGGSFEDLKMRYPEYLPGTNHGVTSNSPAASYLDHTDMKVSDAQLQSLSDAIVAFWRDVPENTRIKDIQKFPGWFATAVAQDQAKVPGAKCFP